MEQGDSVDMDDSYLEDQINASAGSYTATGTTTASVQESLAVVAFKTIVESGIVAIRNAEPHQCSWGKFVRGNCDLGRRSASGRSNGIVVEQRSIYYRPAQRHDSSRSDDGDVCDHHSCGEYFNDGYDLGCLQWNARRNTDRPSSGGAHSFVCKFKSGHGNGRDFFDWNRNTRKCGARWRNIGGTLQQ